MTPPDFRRFSLEDIDPTKSGWIERLITPLNIFLEQTYSLFNSNLTVGDNINGRLIQTTFSTPSDYSTGGFTTFLIPWNKTVNANIVTLGYIKPSANLLSVITEPTSVQWNQINTANIRIDYITGLADSTKYTVRFLIL